MGRLHAELEGPFWRGRRNRYDSGKGEHHMRRREDDENGCAFRRQRSIHERMRMFARAAIGTPYRAHPKIARDVLVIVPLVAWARCVMPFDTLDRDVGFGLVLVRMPMRQRRSRRGEPRTEGESKPE